MIRSICVVPKCLYLVPAPPASRRVSQSVGSLQLISVGATVNRESVAQSLHFLHTAIAKQLPVEDRQLQFAFPVGEKPTDLPFVHRHQLEFVWLGLLIHTPIEEIVPC